MAAPYYQFPPPRPPEDQDIRNIIDKLATFVARNGPEFEQMTMEKQRSNPKFHFLFGGEHNAYYRWKVTNEQTALHPSGAAGIPSLMSQHPSTMLQPPSSSYVAPPSQPYNIAQPPSSQVGMSSSYPQVLPSQGNASTSSSQAPPPPWIQKQHQQVAGQELLQQLKQTKLSEQASLLQNSTDPLEVELSNMVKPVMESCTKDSIAAGKTWIFSHSQTSEECSQVARFLMRKSLNSPGIGFTQKLHIIYLINDVIHHCIRKGAQDLKQAIEDVIVQIFYNVHSSDPDKPDSLLKVLKIWETQKYFSETVTQQIRAVVTENTEELKNIVKTKTTTTTADQDNGPWKHEGAAATANQGMGGSQPPSQPPWQQSQAPPPPSPWPQQGFGGGPPSWNQGSSGVAPSPWPQQQQPTPLFPVAHQEEPPPPPPPSREEHLENRDFHQEGSRGWNENEDKKFTGNTFQDTYPDGREDGSAGSEGLLPTPSLNSGEQPPANDRETISGIGESFDYNHQSVRPSEKRGMGPGGDVQTSSGGREVFEYNHQSRDQPPRAHDRWDQGALPPPPSLHREQREHHQRDRWDMGPPGRPHGHWEAGAGPVGSHDPREQWGEAGPPPPPPHPPLDVWEGGPPPMHPGPPGMWEPRPPFPPHMPPPPVGQPWEGPGPPPGFPPPHDPNWHPPPPLPPPPPSVPSVPYFDLPAGIMASMVPLHEHNYRPLNPKDCILPHPQPPTDKLLKAVEEFYQEDTEGKRNDEGWEARSLLGFFETKRRAKESITRQARTRRPPPPVRRNRRARSQSRSPRRKRRSYSRSRSRSRSYSKSRSRSRSQSPRHRRRRSSRSPSSDRSRSHSPPYRRQRSRSRSRSPFIPTVRTPPRRRNSSPEENRPAFIQSRTVDTKLEEENMGHQILKKMGWEGSGLGAQMQGIEEPIKAGDARDKIDKYKGVGMDMKDPFEMFRKNKSYSFTRRDRERPPR